MSKVEAYLTPTRKKILALATVVILVLAGASLLFKENPVVKAHVPSRTLPTDYMVMVEEPQSEWEMFYIACLAPIINHNGYHPFFILQEGQLDAHSLWTIEHSTMADLPKLVFTNSTEVAAKLSSQVKGVERLNMSRAVLDDFAGFLGTVTVKSYREALWVGGLAAAKNYTISMGPSKYKTQEAVWKEMKKLSIPASYVVVTNPRDWDASKFDQWHVRALSAVAGEMAALHRAYVITDIKPTNQSIVDMGGNKALEDLNANCTGLLSLLRNVSKDYGPIGNIAIVGSSAAVPQFELPDFSQSEADKQVSSDSCYGFLDGNGSDDFTMDAAVGRIINYNVQGAANQLVRTYCYDRLTDTVDVTYSNGQTVTRNWRTHGSSFNGYQITHQRMQATPGYYWCEDARDEGMTYEYYGPTGIGTGPLSSQTVKESDFDPILQCSGFMAYRGHGSWHGSLYSLRIYFEFMQQGSVEGSEARDLFLPAQVALFASCENAKICGKSFSGTDIQFERIFSLGYLYAGTVGFVGATEVSYSDLGQDISAIAGRATGDHGWNLNNAMYAFFWDGVLDHEQDKSTLGQCYMWMMNRYIKDKGGQLTPLKQADPTGGGADWKTVAMYVLYGDPAFDGWKNKSGANQKDEWHNGPDDQ